MPVEEDMESQQGQVPGMIGVDIGGTIGRTCPTELPGKVTVDVQAGDILTINTPGGGGFLSEEENHVDNSN
jgi:N-methylhydantoinase B/oxoprolinase/acetone carboxylase alpha subunit